VTVTVRSFLYLYDNRLSGSIPSSLGLLTALECVHHRGLLVVRSVVAFDYIAWIACCPFALR
jgi:hypothetical protein